MVYYLAVSGKGRVTVQHVIELNAWRMRHRGRKGE